MLYVVLAVMAAVLVAMYLFYIKTSYYRITKTSPIILCFDKGKRGEYLTYRYLRGYEKNGAKLLFNIYIPKGQGETTEIDILMIHEKGLFVLESKNFSGWIFGSEQQKNWYQTLPKGRGRSHKESFYNPVMQNRSHIKHLKSLMGEDIPMHSIVIFSERCTLKKVDVRSDDVRVINRNGLYAAVAAICAQKETAVLNNEQILAIHDRLYPYTQVSDRTKEQHIRNIERKQEKSCPRCNGVLVLRTASKGANVGKRFYGCSNFPKCRYMEKLE